MLQFRQADALISIENGLKSIKNKLDAFATNSRLGKDLLSKSDVDHLQEQLQNLSLLEKQCAKEQSILQSLTFDTRHVRRTQIAAAHRKTFEWALKTDTDEKNGSSIGKWLEQGNDIFWVSGKPGSGKSTLMKFIADSPITSELLRKWAQPSKVTIARHYFWLSGTEMQRSHQGLLQTLLYEIFQQSPHLIQETCANRWTSSDPATSWSLSELHHSFQTVSKMTTNLRFCFFIDGMDEYDGDHEDRIQLCQIFKDLVQSGSIKLCLSSRPWNVFEEAFGTEFPKLYVQDLTRNDIQNYVQARLQEHPEWDAISAKDSQGQALVSEITAKADGVFLWVFLVVKLLRESLTNLDEIFVLRRRLQSFPSELGPFFKTILESVEPFYHSHMSTTLQLGFALDGHEPNFLLFHFHSQEYSDEAYAINLPIEALSTEDIQEIKRNTTRHLNGRTRGLLEIHPENGTVHFLHRTARDFLMTKEMREFLVAKADKDFDFDPTLSIIKALVAMIKIDPQSLKINRTAFGEYDTNVENVDGMVGLQNDTLVYLKRALEFAAKLEIGGRHQSRHYSLLDELDRSFLFLLSEKDCISTPSFISRRKQAVFRENLVRHGLFGYLDSKIKVDPTFLANIGSLPLQRFLRERPDDYTSLKRGPGTDVLINLIQNNGFDLNEYKDFAGTSPWQELLSQIESLREKTQSGALYVVNFLLEEGIMMLCLEAGADPNVAFHKPSFFLPSQGKKNTRTAAVMYLKFCRDFTNQSASRQTVYLEVLKEFLCLSSHDTAAMVCEEFTTLLTGMVQEKVTPRSLLFMSKVNHLLLQSLAIRGPVMKESKLRQDAVAREVFPPELYTSVGAVGDSNRGKRKRKNDSKDGRRKGKHRR